MLWQRLLFGILMIAAIGGVAVFDGWLSAWALAEGAEGATAWEAGARLWCGLPITAVVIALVVLATYELGRLCQGGGHRPATHWAVFVGALLTIVPWIEMQQRMGPAGAFGPAVQVNFSLAAFLLTGAVLGTCLAVLMRKTTEGAVSSMAVTLLMVLYVGLLGSFVVRLRCLQPGPAGAGLAVLFVVTVKSGDIGAYFVGKFLGKHKLAVWLSPGKTIEGAIGAVAVAAAVAMGCVAGWHEGIGTLGPVPLSFAQALLFGVVMAIGGQLGDLIESAIKRDAGRKDSGRVVPAFGGLLDIVDSPIFTAPIAWWLLTRWTSIG